MARFCTAALHVVAACLAAAATCAALGSIVQTQLNLQALSALSAEIDMLVCAITGWFGRRRTPTLE